MADNKKPTDDLLKAMEKFITTKSVVGEPVVVGDTIILPMADVSFGMGIGTFSKGETGSGGVGGKIVPSAVLVIKDGSSKLISIKDQDGLSRIIDMGPEGGDKGGTVIAKGTPEEVAESPVSYTGKYIKPMLEK